MVQEDKTLKGSIAKHLSAEEQSEVVPKKDQMNYIYICRIVYMYMLPFLHLSIITRQHNFTSFGHT